MDNLKSERFDERRAIVELLSALEYGSKKEELDVITPILDYHNLSRLSKNRLAEMIQNSPGFEPFFLTILNQIRPFSLMMAETYSFLNSCRTTVDRRASKFLVEFEKAKTQLQFDLHNFPKELLKAISEVDRFGSVIELRFPGINLADSLPQWKGTKAHKNWNAISPNWDNDFYDDAFFRALSYGHTVLRRVNSTGPSVDYESRADAIATPILDRLAAICDFIYPLLPTDSAIVGQSVTSYLSKRGSDLVIKHIPATSHIVRDPQAAAYLSHDASESWNRQGTLTVLNEIYYEVRAFAIALNIWNNPDLQREDNDWAKSHFGCDLSDVHPEMYLDYLADLAKNYLSRLDEVAPVVDTFTYKQMLEHLLEFLSLPFWQQRWYLYELWTLVRTLEIGRRVGNVELSNVHESTKGVLNWMLPGGMAQQPVATLSKGGDQILFWSQRKTYHPGTGEGLEPDLRITKQVPGYHDILIIENKDRRTAQTKDLAEILSRYVGGTCADAVWLVNYEKFPNSAGGLKQQWPDRQVHIVSNFRPGLLPAEFEHEIEHIFRKYLVDDAPADLADSTATTSIRVNKKSAALESIDAVLGWNAVPRDLDLHAWLVTASETHHIYFGERGSLVAPPYAELDIDAKSGNGREMIRVRGATADKIVIAVHNYSKELTLNSSSATVKVTINDATEVQLEVPKSGAGEWWHVASLDKRTNEIEIVQMLGDDPPFPV